MVAEAPLDVDLLGARQCGDARPGEAVVDGAKDRHCVQSWLKASRERPMTSTSRSDFELPVAGKP